MLMSGILGENLFDEFWGFPTHALANIDKHLYGKNAQHLMKTDVHENDSIYELEMDLPGFKKDQINVELNDGYMTISAAKDHDESKKDKNGKVIRQECKKLRTSSALSFLLFLNQSLLRTLNRTRNILRTLLLRSHLRYILSRHQ